MEIDYARLPRTAFQIGTDALASAIIELNSMSPCDGVVMDRSGHVRTGYKDEPDLLCLLIPAPLLARQLTADGLSSYTGKEIRKWSEAYDKAPLQQKVDEAVQQWLDSISSAEGLLPFLRACPDVASAELGEGGSILLSPEEGKAVPELARALAAAISC